MALRPTAALLLAFPAVVAAAASRFTWTDVTAKDFASRRSLATAASSTAFVRRAASDTSFVFELAHDNATVKFHQDDSVSTGGYLPPSTCTALSCRRAAVAAVLPLAFMFSAAVAQHAPSELPPA